MSLLALTLRASGQEGFMESGVPLLEPQQSFYPSRRGWGLLPETTLSGLQLGQDQLERS